MPGASMSGAWSPAIAAPSIFFDGTVGPSGGTVWRVIWGCGCLFLDAVEPLPLRLGLVHATPRGLMIAGSADRVAEGGPRISRVFRTGAPRMRYGSIAG